MSAAEPAGSPSAHDRGPAEASDPQARFRVWSLAYYTVPFHLVAPALIAWAGRDHVELVSDAWMAVHLLFPIVLVLSYPWWQGQGEQVLGLIVVNHVASFATIIALALVFG